MGSKLSIQWRKTKGARPTGFDVLLTFVVCDEDERWSVKDVRKFVAYAEMRLEGSGVPGEERTVIDMCGIRRRWEIEAFVMETKASIPLVCFSFPYSVPNFSSVLPFRFLPLRFSVFLLLRITIFFYWVLGERLRVVFSGFLQVEGLLANWRLVEMVKNWSWVRWWLQVLFAGRTEGG